MKNTIAKNLTNSKNFANNLAKSFMQYANADWLGKLHHEEGVKGLPYFQLVAQRLAEYKSMFTALKEGHRVSLSGCGNIHKAHMAAALSFEREFLPTFSSSGRPSIAILLARTEGECTRLVSDINTLTGEETAVLFPARDVNLSLIAGGSSSSSLEYERMRLRAMQRLFSDKSSRVAVCTAEAAAQVTVPHEAFGGLSVTLRRGSDYNMEGLKKRLLSMGYAQRELVTEECTFSSRGNILDICMPGGDFAPVRVELWGDNVEIVYSFDPETQRRISEIDSVLIPPCREFIFTEAEKRDDFLARLLELQKLVPQNILLSNVLAEDIKQLQNGEFPENPERYAPYVYDRCATLFDVAERVIVSEHLAVTESYAAAHKALMSETAALLESGRIVKELAERQYATPAVVAAKIQDADLHFDTLARKSQSRTAISMSANQIAAAGGEIAQLRADIAHYYSLGCAVCVFSGTERQAKTLAIDLSEGTRGEVQPVPGVDYAEKPKHLYAKRTYVMAGTLSGGYYYPDAKCVCITLFSPPGITNTAVVGKGVSRQTTGGDRKNKKREPAALHSLDDVKIGDYCVHNRFGIGEFAGIEKLQSLDGDGKNVTRDYIKMKYHGSDVLYVPVTQLDQIAKYIGTGGTDAMAGKPRVQLSKLHSDQWVRAKSRARAAAEEIADELVELYRKRMSVSGFKFKEDGVKQRGFENHFPFVETEDQLRCVSEIKSDMQSERPMDRLLCGDVGFGKTEVALRAAFKCIENGKQVALLCPTTVLAWQHFQTAQKRMEGFDVRIELLSRFRTAAEIKESLLKAELHEADFFIGTHRIVGKDVEFADLGLIIIDEEQRFGVAQKDKLKIRYPGVDVLTLSATPIPRTLNMAMTGVRDMSVIEAPPYDRIPVTTYVTEYDPATVGNAIQKEMRRDGQVYYIYNRVETIVEKAAQIQELVPEARIGIAHGQMSEEEVLEVWRKLLEYEIDILICTTLIETGVDVPNCNTLIIENADYMGLSQLHQLRGRVGRSGRRAFAYFTYGRGKILTEAGEKRLNAIREFSEFGSGFKVAMRDLEIRGAGSLLGTSQSGNMSAVGYDMYVKMLAEANALRRRAKKSRKRVKSEALQLPVDFDCRIDLAVNGYIPEEYIPSGGQRIRCYKRISLIRDEHDLSEVREELVDRYGAIPESVKGLLDSSLIKAMAARAGITEIVQTGSKLTCAAVDYERITASLPAIRNRMGERIMMNLTGDGSIEIKLLQKENPIAAAKQFLVSLSGYTI